MKINFTSSKYSSHLNFNGNGFGFTSKFFIWCGFLIILAYPPLVFTDKLPDEIRISCFFLLTLYLFFKTKILLLRHVVGLSLLTILIVVQLFRIDFQNQLDVRNAASFFLTLTFAVALDRASDNNVLNVILVKFYVFLFTLIPILMIFTICWYYIFGQLNIFNLRIGADPNTFLYTPFGTLLPGSLGGIFLRSANFFHEPVFLAFFLGINTYFPVVGSGFCARNFSKLNFVGGILTLSVLYVLIVVAGLLLRGWFQYRLRGKLIITAVVFILIDLFYPILESISSLNIRLDRASIYFSLYPMLSISELWLGAGFNPVAEINNSISTGLFTLLYKFGIIGLVCVVMLIWVLTRNNIFLFIACLFALLSYEPYLFPLFWFGIISFVSAIRQSTE